MARLRVFLSHLTIEKQLAEILMEALKRDFIGLAEFFVSSDTTSIPVGEKWLEKTVAGLKDADLHLVLCSPEAVRRLWISFETGAAYLRGTPIIPICHSGISPDQLPAPLSAFEGLRLSDREGLLKLYNSIASKLGSGVPDARLGDLASDVARFESVYQKRIDDSAACEFTPTAVGRIKSPRVLCVSSEQFMRLGVEDFKIILKAFPGTVDHQQVLTSPQARDVLMKEHFDIIHIATYICPKTGDLVFSDINTESGENICHPRDFLTPEAFASLADHTHASLVVIASCESFVFAASVLTVTNVVATRDIVTPAMFASWVENFYGALPVQTLSEAFDYAVKASRAPMKLLARQDLTMKRDSLAVSADAV